jgi:type IV pilus assembly protein PilC
MSVDAYDEGDDGFGLLKPRVSLKVHRGIRGDDILSFFRQLSTLIGASTPIYESIVIAGEQGQSTELREVVSGIAQKVAGGSALYGAMLQHGEHFRREWIEIIRSGEISGQLARVLAQLTEQVDRARVLRGKIVSAMIYPAILFAVCVLCVVVLIVKVVPTFASMFTSTGKRLPDITQFVLDLSEFLQHHGLELLAGIAIFVLLFRRYARTSGGRATIHSTLLGLPIVGDVLVISYMQRFANNGALLLRAGMPLNETIATLASIFETNVLYQRAMRRVQRDVECGGELADAVEHTGLFTSLAVSMIRVGEQSGRLPQVLDDVEVYYRRKLETVVVRMTASLETVVIIVMGAIVAAVLSAIYLPMFSMSSGVR